MNSIHFSYPLLLEVYKDLKSKIISNHFATISAINSSDILVSFSFYNKEKLFISLNHTSPFISLIDSSFALASIKGGLNENLRKLMKGTIIKDIALKDNDRVITFTLERTNEFFEKITLYLVLELIPTKANLLILDKDKNILYAYKYMDFTHARAILRGLKYPELPIRDIKINEEISIEEFKKNVNHYLLESTQKRQRENNKPLYDYLVSKRKSLLKKLDVLAKEIKEAENKLIYQEYGEYLYTYMYDEESLNDYIQTLGDLYDKDLSPKDNANRLFNLYKKNKRTIEMDNLEIIRTQKEIDDLSNAINTFTYLNEDEINELYNRYLSFKQKKPLRVKEDARMPFYIEYKGTVIAFGKNSNQNDYLTFKKAHKEYTFLHIDKLSGSHVIIFKDNPNNDELLLGSEIALILSNETTGDIKYTKVENIKKGTSKGEALLSNYKLITLRKIKEETYELLKNQKRFIS